MPFVVGIMKCTWFASVNDVTKTLSKWVDRLKQNVGILPIYDSVFSVHNCSGVKYKSVAKKVVLVSVQDPDATIPMYKDIQIGELSNLPVFPKQMEDLKFMKWLMKERVLSIISKVPVGFLMKSEAKLLIHILFQYKWAIAFTDLEHGTFSQKYYIFKWCPELLEAQGAMRASRAYREVIVSARARCH